MSESNITKNAVADSLKRLTEKKAFDKISVGEISEEAGINRQTFYYHFTDKYELLEWIYKEEIVNPIMNELDFNNWDDKLCGALKVMISEKQFYLNTIKHAEDYVSRFFLENARRVFEDAIDVLDEEKNIDEKARRFYAGFFANGLCGSLMEWIFDGMNMSAEEITELLTGLKKTVELMAYGKVSKTL